MVETVLEKVTLFLIEYAKAFKEAGANGIMMAEPAAGLLSPSLIEEFSNPYVQRIREAVEDDNFLFVYHNCGNITPIMSHIPPSMCIRIGVFLHLLPLARGKECDCHSR
jgi:uroporphyrinogen decarboxylase